MIKKILILIIAMFLLIPLANAVSESDLDTNLTSYWDLDRDESLPKDQVNENNNWTKNTGTSFATGCFNNGCMNITGQGEHGIYDNSLSGWDSTNDEFTLSGWFNPNTAERGAAGMFIFGGHADLTFGWKYDDPLCEDTTSALISSAGTSWDIANEDCGDTITVNDGIWYHWIFGYNGTHFFGYLDGSEIYRLETATHVIDLTGLHFGDWGAGNSVDSYWDGPMDEIVFWNRGLTKQEIEFLYNSGAGRFASGGTFVTGGTSSTFTLTAVDAYDSSTINNFTVTIFNSTDAYVNVTTTGSITYDNLSGIYNISINSTQDGGYYNLTFGNINVSSDFEAAIYQAILYVNASEIITGNTITDFWVTSSNQNNKSNSTGWAKLLVKAGDINISANATGYVRWWQTITIDNNQEKYTNISLGTSNFTIKASSILTGLFIENFTVTLEHADPAYSYSITKTTKNGSVFGSNDDNIVFRAIAGNYNLTINSTGYEDERADFSIDIGNMYPNYTFSLYTENSFNFTFYDEQTKVIIDFRNVTLEFISNISSYNYTTDNGSLYIDLLVPSLYLIRFSADDYAERHYYFKLVNRTHNNLDLYLINASLVTDVTATIIDESNDKVEGAYIKVMRYELATNAYTTREIYKTNVEGETQLNLIQDDEFYKFIIEYPFGTIKKTTDPSYIFDSTIEIQILIGQEVATKFYNSQGIDYSLTFNNLTNAYTFTYSDPNNLVSQGCLEIYKITARGRTLFNNSCATSSSASIVLKVANETGVTYEGKGFVGFSPPTYYLASLMHTFLEGGNPIGNSSLLYLSFMTIILGFVGFWNLAVMIMIIPLPTMFFSLGGLITIPLQAIIALQIVALIIAFVINKYS
jgi:hypothetical protein